ncbi:MAG: hypothetical protein ACYS7M_04295 [Planctomycetota bacterium]
MGCCYAPTQKFYLHCRLDTGDQPTIMEVPVALTSPAMPAKLDQTVKLPEPLAPIRLLEYLPRATLEQEIIPDPGTTGKPAILIAIEGPTQSHRRWLVADDPRRNRLKSFIGTWRYMAVETSQQRDALFEQFQDYLTRDPMVVVTRADPPARVELPARAGAERDLGALGGTLKVKKFFPHFTIQGQTMEPINQSDQRLNPAVLVEIEVQGRRQERWVFAEYPDYTSGDNPPLPYDLTLDCPTAQGTTPDYAVLSVAGQALEVWTRQSGKTAAQPLAVDQKVPVGTSQYTFRLARFVPAGRLVEQYRPTEGKGGVSAVKIRTADASGQDTTLWLELGKQRVVRTAKGPLVVVFTPGPSGAAKRGHQ